MRPDAKAIAKEVVGNLRPHFDDTITDLFDHLETTISMIIMAEREIAAEGNQLLREKIALLAENWLGSLAFKKALEGQIDLKARVASKRIITREMNWFAAVIREVEINIEPTTIPGHVLEETLN